MTAPVVPAVAVSAGVEALLESDAMTPNNDLTPDYFYVDPENVEYLVTIVVRGALGALA